MRPGGDSWDRWRRLENGVLNDTFALIDASAVAGWTRRRRRKRGIQEVEPAARDGTRSASSLPPEKEETTGSISCVEPQRSAAHPRQGSSRRRSLSKEPEPTHISIPDEISKTASCDVSLMRVETPPPACRSTSPLSAPAVRPSSFPATKTTDDRHAPEHIIIPATLAQGTPKTSFIELSPTQGLLAPAPLLPTRKRDRLTLHYFESLAMGSQILLARPLCRSAKGTDVASAEDVVKAAKRAVSVRNLLKSEAVIAGVLPTGSDAQLCAQLLADAGCDAIAVQMSCTDEPQVAALEAACSVGLPVIVSVRVTLQPNNATVSGSLPQSARASPTQSADVASHRTNRAGSTNDSGGDSPRSVTALGSPLADCHSLRNRLHSLDLARFASPTRDSQRQQGTENNSPKHELGHWLQQQPDRREAASSTKHMVSLAIGHLSLNNKSQVVAVLVQDTPLWLVAASLAGVRSAGWCKHLGVCPRAGVNDKGSTEELNPRAFAAAAQCWVGKLGIRLLGRGVGLPAQHIRVLSKARNALRDELAWYGKEQAHNAVVTDVPVAALPCTSQNLVKSDNLTRAGRTLLHAAARAGSEETCRAMSRGADLGQVDDFGVSPAATATFFGHLQLRKALTPLVQGPRTSVSVLLTSVSEPLGLNLKFFGQESLVRVVGLVKGGAGERCSVPTGVLLKVDDVIIKTLEDVVIAVNRGKTEKRLLFEVAVHTDGRYDAGDKVEVVKDLNVAGRLAVAKGTVAAVHGQKRDEEGRMRVVLGDLRRRDGKSGPLGALPWEIVPASTRRARAIDYSGAYYDADTGGYVWVFKTQQQGQFAATNVGENTESWAPATLTVLGGWVDLGTASGTTWKGDFNGCRIDWCHGGSWVCVQAPTEIGCRYGLGERAVMSTEHIPGCRGPGDHGMVVAERRVESATMVDSDRHRCLSAEAEKHEDDDHGEHPEARSESGAIPYEPTSPPLSLLLADADCIGERVQTAHCKAGTYRACKLTMAGSIKPSGGKNPWEQVDATAKEDGRSPAAAGLASGENRPSHSVDPPYVNGVAVHPGTLHEETQPGCDGCHPQYINGVVDVSDATPLAWCETSCNQGEPCSTDGPAMFIQKDPPPALSMNSGPEMVAEQRFRTCRSHELRCLVLDASETLSSSSGVTDCARKPLEKSLDRSRDPLSRCASSSASCTPRSAPTASPVLSPSGAPNSRLSSPPEPLHSGHARLIAATLSNDAYEVARLLDNGVRI
ncbi:hypothetical protein DIPPA_11774 [Diplonema papillatum]|nr:hypothetical protein DIPPA_11774 [Diplonema papillatum]